MTTTPLFQEKIDTILKLSKEDLIALTQAIKYQIKEQEELELRAAIRSHIKLVGKCYKTRVKPKDGLFPEMWKYYKIISERASSEYCVSALTFNEFPVYWFNYQMSKTFRVGDYYCGEYDFESIIIENLNLYNDNDFIEISLKEYNEAMNLYIKRLQMLNWPADHYRLSGALPGEEKWER